MTVNLIGVARRRETVFDLATALLTPPPIGGTTPNTGAFTSLSATVTDTNTTLQVDVLDVVHAVSSGTPVSTFGEAIRFRGHSATPANGLRTMARVRSRWQTVADATYIARLILSTWQMVAGTPTEVDTLTLDPTASSLVGSLTLSNGLVVQASGITSTGNAIFTNPSIFRIERTDNAGFTIRGTSGGNKDWTVSTADVTQEAGFGANWLKIASPTEATSVGLLFRSPSATSGTTTQNSRPLVLLTSRWTGSANALEGYSLQAIRDSATAADYYLAFRAGTNSTPTTRAKLYEDGDFELGSANELYLGDRAADGSWRFARSGNDLVIQRREAGSFVTKSTIAA